MTDITDSAGPAAPGNGPTAPAVPAPPVPAPAVPAPPVLAPATADTVGTADPLDPFDVWADRTVLLDASTGQTQDRRRQRRGAALRWGAAALVVALTGTATALAVTAPDRTDLPGLATPNDGRYAFPKLELPPLPSGRPSPAETTANGRHYADLRHLVLPAPKGATPDRPAAGATPSASPSAASRAPASTAAPASAVPDPAWSACTDFASSRAADDSVAAEMSEFGCRAAVRRVWTAGDGTRTEIWLFRSGSPAEATGLYSRMSMAPPKDMPGIDGGDFTLDREMLKLQGSTELRQSRDKGADGTPTTRLAHLVSGDVVGVVLMTNPRGVAAQPFRQVTVMQEQLLQ